MPPKILQLNQKISLQGLARTEPLSQLAKRNQVSRRFVYRQMAKGRDALDQAFNSRESEQQVLFWIPVTKSWLRQVVLVLVCAVIVRLGELLPFSAIF